MADLVRDQAPEAERQTASRAVDDLVVVAEFRDPVLPEHPEIACARDRVLRRVRDVVRVRLAGRYR